MRTLCLLLGCVLATPLAAVSPIAEVLCEPTEHMRDRLVGTMMSTRTASGLRDREQVFEVWTDPQGDWTLVVRYATGTSCIVAMGEHWMADTDPAS